MRNRWCFLTVAIITLLSIWPQLRFWIERGADWQGSYIILQMDESIYSTYVESVVDGRPRRSDPIVGRDDRSNARMPESLFSIQYLPPFVLGSLGRVFNASTSTMFIALLPIGGLLGSLSVYWLIFSATREAKITALGTLLTFALAGPIAGQGLIGLLLDPETRFLGLPFLRRYQPAAAWPLFFLFIGLVWRVLTGSRTKVSALFGVLVFTAMIFSYFYLWTAALAWSAAAVSLWALFRPTDLRQNWPVLLVGLLSVALGIMLFGYLAWQPSGNGFIVFTDTRRPDLFRPTEIVAFILLVSWLLSSRRGSIPIAKPQTLIGLSLIVLPFLLFNQQVITGRSIQPFHHEVLVGNYALLVGVALFFNLFQLNAIRKLATTLMVVCVIWTFVEVESQYRANAASATRNDETVPVMRELKVRANSDGTWNALKTKGSTDLIVFSPSYTVCSLLPSWAPQPSLLSVGAAAYASIDPSEQRKRLHLHLYFSGYSPDSLRSLLASEVDPFSRNIKTTLFGPESVVKFLGKHRLITAGDISAEVRLYDEFLQSLSGANVTEYPLAYVIADQDADLSNVDRWYARDAGVLKGKYLLYHVTRKQEIETK